MRTTPKALAFCVLLLFGSAQGADTVQYGPAAAWIKAQALPDNDESMADAPLKTLLRNHQIRFTATGSELYTESYVRLQTAAGLQAFSSFGLPWRPDTDVLTVHKLHLLRGEKIIDLIANGQRFEILRRENNLEYSALDGVLTAAIQPAGMEVGDLFNIAVTITRNNQLSTAPEMVLAGMAEFPISRIEVRALWDKNLPMKWKATEEVAGIKESRAGNQVELVWSAKDLAPITQPNNTPLRFWREPRISFTGYASWNDISRKLAPLYAVAAQLSADSAVKAEAKAIADSTQDPLARLEGALKLAQERVRYVFLGMGEGGLNPANADTTWERRFGDCKAKTALLIAVLREMGIQAEPVAVHTMLGDILADQPPMLAAFDHVIVRAQVGARSYWLDGAGAGSWHRTEMELPNYTWGLPLTARGEGLLRMVAAPATHPSVEISTEIDASAGLHTDAPFSVRSVVRGASAVTIYSQLSALTPAIREQSLRNYWEQRYDFVKVMTAGVKLDEATGLVTMSMDGTADMAWWDYRYTTDGLFIGGRADFARKPGINVDAPFHMQHPDYTITRQRIKLPAVGTFTTSGKDYDVTLAGTHYIRRSKIEQGVFSGEASTRTLVPEISASEARAAEKALNAMWRDKLQVVAKGYAATDADVAALKTRDIKDAPNLIWRGNVQLDRRMYDEAFADFDAAVKADEKSASALAHRGLAQFWLGKQEAAKTDFEAALAKEPRNEVALRGLGVFHLHRRQYPVAIEKLSASLAIEPDSAFALGNRAFAYWMVEDGPGALKDSAEAIRLSPDYTDMFDLRARIFASQDHKDEALREIEAMLTAAPDSTAALRYAARNYMRLGRSVDAMAAMDRIVAKGPDADNFLERAYMRENQDFAGRLADVDAALAARPEYPPAVSMRIQTLAESGDHQGAIAGFTAALKKARRVAEKRHLWTGRGIEYLKLGQMAASRQDFAAALSEDPDGDSYNNFCWQLATARLKLEEALAACEKAVSIAPKDPAYLDSKGFALLQLGRFDEAIAAYDAALSTDGKRAASLFGRGMAKKRRCQCDAGDADLKAGLREDYSIGKFFASAGVGP